jgi:hypothetical protein
MAMWNKNTQAYMQDNKTLFEAFLLADKDGNIINSFGVASNIPIAAGLVDGYGHINKFGASSGDIESGTIWDGNGVGNANDVVYPYPADSVVAVASGSNSGAGVLVEGLDANFESASETINIGSTGATVFSRIFRARMVDTNNDADVSLTMGGTEAARIIEDKSQTLMAVYTVPAGKTAYLIKAQMGSDKASTNASLKYALMARDTDDGNVFQIKGISYAAGGQNVVVEYPVPLKFEEKTDIRVDVLAPNGGQTCSATLDLILVDNE